LTPDIARLVEPKPEPFAAAIIELLERPDERARLSAAARIVAQDKYSRESYMRRTAQAYDRLRVHRLRTDEPLGSSSSL
jgi:glycosyltransferase involved in cell wall biosynthesis